MCNLINIYTHTHIQTHIHTDTHIQIHTHIYIHTHTDTHTQIQTHTHIHIHTHTHTHTYTHTHTHPWENQCEWHRMTRMTGPDCAVMCNLINTHTHTYTHLRQEHENKSLAEVAVNPHHGERHPREVAVSVPHENTRRIPETRADAALLMRISVCLYLCICESVCVCECQYLSRTTQPWCANHSRLRVLALIPPMGDRRLIVVNTAV